MLAIVTALPSEARPLIDLYRLKAPSEPTPFPLYRSDTCLLVVSGIGKINTAIAVAQLQAMLPKSTLAWLNVGIAGHRHLEIGTSILGHKITDHASQHTFYPTFLKQPLLPTCPILTVDQPEKAFTEEDTCYEMEASGFMQAALKFSSSELVHCYKVISDNTGSSITFNARSVQTLIEGQLSAIQTVASDLQALASQLPDCPPLAEFIRHWHFTATEQHQLQRLLTRWHAQFQEWPTAAAFKSIAKASELLYTLDRTLNSAPLHF